jgi:lipopolysaccharide/colanic/teichoic acid biosynthesis glycosyltransferase
MRLSIDEIIDRRSLIYNVSKAYLWIKRFLDIAVSLSAIILLSPIMLAASIWIKIRFKVAVLNIEEKYGLRGKSFKACEFANVSKCIYILKLPLLFNVLKGDMSLVGPLPTPKGDPTNDDWYNLRMSAKPGITGLWQVNGKKGGVNEMVRVDLKYIRERSLSNDIKIFLKAIYLIFKKGHK